MHETVDKILKQNNIILSENDNSKDKMEIIIREVLKIQNTFVSLNSSSQWNTEAAIKSMKAQLEASLGAAMS